MARIDCPFRDDGTFIQLPDEWLGEHSIRQYKAIEGLEGKGYPAHIHNFVVGMAMLDDWSIPGLTANPETWDVTKAPITVMVWMWNIIRESYEASFVVPKKKSSPSLNGQPEAEMTARADGTLEATAPLVG